MAAKVTKRQQAVLDCIEDCIREKGYGPTVREVCHALGLSSPSTVHVHLKALEEKGLIKRDPLKSRSISLTYPLEGSSVQASSAPDVVQPSFSKIVNVPLVGDVAAGVPILAEENIENYFPVPAEFMPNEQSFMLKVKGESMINVGIFDGDSILVKEQNTARNGDIVVALIDDSSTVKTFYKEDGHIRLQPENDTMDPIIVEDCTILGKVFGVFRFF